MRLTQQRLSNCCQDLIIVVMANIKGEIAVNAFHGAGPIKTACPTGANAASYRIVCEVLNDVAGPAAGELGLRVTPGIPHLRHVL